jgi:hypothetical protein
MTLTKYQNRWRCVKLHFTNADLLLADTTGLFLVIPPIKLKQLLSVKDVRYVANIAAVYTGIDANAFCSTLDDFSIQGALENISGGTGPQNINDLLGTGPGVNLAETSTPILSDSGSAVRHEILTEVVFDWLDFNDLFVNGGIYFNFNNGGADLTGGDPANFMDVFIEYDILDV